MDGMKFGVTVLLDPPHTQFLDLVGRAEAEGFQGAWTFDSHLMWYDSYPLLALAADRTSTIHLGHCVTNPRSRDPSVTASAYATLQEISLGRMVLGIGRGGVDPNARLTRALRPSTVRELENAILLMKALMSGESVEREGRVLELPWASDLPAVPIYVAAYGPKTLDLAARLADGVIIQPADPEIIEWILGLLRMSAAKVGRDFRQIKVVACAPAYVTDDWQRARDQVRWFPAMVSNHVLTLLERYSEAELPQGLHRFVRARRYYEPKEHSRVGAQHASFVDDATCDRFCLLGPVEAQIQKIEHLRSVGVTDLNIYLMTEDREHVLSAYGGAVIPTFAG